MFCVIFVLGGLDGLRGPSPHLGTPGTHHSNFVHVACPSPFPSSPPSFLPAFLCRFELHAGALSGCSIRGWVGSLLYDLLLSWIPSCRGLASQPSSTVLDYFAPFELYDLGLIMLNSSHALIVWCVSYILQLHAGFGCMFWGPC